jgi:tRNA (guanine37-N1)-methyltransferase
MIDVKSLSKTLVLPSQLVPIKSLNDFLKKKKSEIFTHINMKTVLPYDKDHKIVLFKQDATVETSRSETIVIPYEKLTFHECLELLLPPGTVIPSSFETIGHIANFHLLDDLLEYKYYIGEICLDKFRHIKTVINKVGTISHQFRILPFEVIAGDKDRLTATVKENGLILEVPYDKVYWNSRLNSERERVRDFCLSKLSKEDSLRTSLFVDVFGGIGALSCMMAKQQSDNFEVVCNDLNPECAPAVRRNMEINKVSFEVFSMDGRDFINHLESKGYFTKKTDLFLMMNLPEIAIEFLDVFKGLLGDLKSENTPKMTAMVHCFAKGDTDELVREEINQRIEQVLAPFNIPSDYEIVRVRDVAPQKRMFCVNIQIPMEILRGDPRRASSSPKRKRTH